MIHPHSSSNPPKVTDKKTDFKYQKYPAQVVILREHYASSFNSSAETVKQAFTTTDNN